MERPRGIPNEMFSLFVMGIPTSCFVLITDFRTNFFDLARYMAGQIAKKSFFSDIKSVTKALQPSS